MNSHTDFAKEISKLEKSLNNYASYSEKDSQLIHDIKKDLIERNQKDLFNACQEVIQKDINTLKEHQRMTYNAIHPFIDIGGTAVENHELIMLDPFVNVEDDQLLKNFDALILNRGDNLNILIFIETKTRDFTEKLLNQLIEKIKLYETSSMQNEIKENFTPLEIHRVEYVLLLHPHRLDNIRNNLIGKTILIEKEGGNVEEVPVPLIVWTIQPVFDNPNKYYLLIQPYTDDIRTAIQNRQYHQNHELVGFLSHRSEFDISTQLISFDYSPVLETNFQLINATIELLKLFNDKIFNYSQLKELIEDQLFDNLKTPENVDFIAQRIIKKGLKINLYEEKEDTEDFKIKLRKTIDPKSIESSIINKICTNKTEEKLNSDEFQYRYLKKVQNTYLSSRARKFKTIREWGNQNLESNDN